MAKGTLGPPPQPARVRRPGVGRGDLARVVASIRDAGGTEELVLRAARALGFARRPAAPREPVTPPKAPAVGPPVAPPRAAARPQGITFWQPRELEWRSTERLDEELDGAEERALAARHDDAKLVAARTSQRPRSEPLTGRARLLPLLGQALCQDVPSRELDIPGLVARLSRGEVVASLPRLRRRRWPRVVVIMDRSAELAPVWRDMEALYALLVGILGPMGVAVWCLDQGDEPDAIPAAWIALQAPVVLAVSDLGWYGDGAQRRSWLHLGRRLRRTTAHVHALVPVPPVRWTGQLARIWSPIAWERPTAGDSRMRGGADRLLDLAAHTRRLEPGLLRDLRRIFPRSEVDVGSELDAWNHDDLASRCPGAAVLRASAAESRAERFALLDSETRRRVIQTIRRWHWSAALAPEIWHMEVLALTQQGGQVLQEDAIAGDVAQAERCLTRLQADLRRDGVETGDFEDGRRWLHHVRDYGRGFLPPTRIAGRMLQQAWGATHPPEDLPPHPDLALLARGRTPWPGRSKRVVVRQMGEALELLWPAGLAVGARFGGLVGEVWAGDLTVVPVGLGVATRRVSIASPVEFVARPSSAGPIELRTDRSTLHLAPLTKPSWARAIGRDRFGLWAEFFYEGRGGPGVAYRLRWIPPGRFMMGSPADEPGRDSNEGPEHAVVITRGFWLGETPVTQALWEAVTGDNPSDFKGSQRSPDRPVEQVSWDMCEEALIAALNADPKATEDHEDKPWRLPTEAEWEYACRAGTETATYAGPIEILGAKDASVLDAIAWYGNSEGKTHPVREKRPNPWGLYDMLGNVNEWCSDGAYRNYSDRDESSDVVTDPTGPATGEDRVFRGGSWSFVAGVVRAAFRNAHHPGDRGHDLGLRLARDQVR